MTDRERIDLKEYLRERFDAIDERFDKLDERLQPLEKEFSERSGRRSLYTVVGKTVAVISAFIAAIAAVFGLGQH